METAEGRLGGPRRYCEGDMSELRVPGFMAVSRQGVRKYVAKVPKGLGGDTAGKGRALFMASFTPISVPSFRVCGFPGWIFAKSVPGEGEPLNHNYGDFGDPVRRGDPSLLPSTESMSSLACFFFLIWGAGNPADVGPHLIRTWRG